MNAKGDAEPAAGAEALIADEVLQGRVEVSPELRSRILRQIDQVVSEGLRSSAELELTFRPRKKGILFPLLINGFAAAVVTLGVLGLAYMFRGGQADVSLAGAGFRSTEGRLLELFRRQSESRLQEQQAQAREARERLAAVERSLEERLRRREEALRRALDEELQAERERLSARGLAAAEVERRLRALEAERQAALAAAVSQLRAGLRLQELAEARDVERLVGDRIRSTLAQVLRSLQEGDLPGARGSLAVLNALLEEPVMQENPGLRERLPVDRMLAQALGELLAARTAPAAAPAGAASTRPASAAEPAAPASAAAAPAPAGSAADPALAARLQAAEAEAGALRAQLERARTEAEELKRQVQALQREQRGLKAASEAEAARLSAQLSAAAAREESALETLRSAEQKAARKGRDEAFKEVIGFLDYMKADAAKKQQLAGQLKSRALQDPLYATVVREIQILAAGLGLGGSVSAFKLLGTVSSIASGRVVVEPLVDLAVKAGARVQIRRASGLASETLVARGIVLQAGADRITVLLDSAGKSAPELLDVVYVEAGD